MGAGATRRGVVLAREDPVDVCGHRTRNLGAVATCDTPFRVRAAAHNSALCRYPRTDEGQTSRSGMWNGGRNTVRRLLGLIVIALLVFWVLAQPASAADTIQNLALILRDAAESVISFFTRLVQ
ncbi:hypothetical protein GCM10009609_18440 [Pseudonocardia aurantiaca]